MSRKNVFVGGWHDCYHAQRGKEPTRRMQIYEFICSYADEKDGPTPSIREVSKAFDLAYGTVHTHVLKLIRDGLIRQEDGKLIIVGADLILPFSDASPLPR